MCTAINGSEVFKPQKIAIANITVTLIVCGMFPMASHGLIDNWLMQVATTKLAYSVSNLCEIRGPPALAMLGPSDAWQADRSVYNQVVYSIIPDVFAQLQLVRSYLDGCNFTECAANILARLCRCDATQWMSCFCLAFQILTSFLSSVYRGVLWYNTTVCSHHPAKLAVFHPVWNIKVYY